MQRQSQQVLRHLEISEEIESSVEIQGPTIGRTLNEMHSPRFENRRDNLNAPDFVSVLFILKEQLADSRRHLAEADHVHVEQLRKIVDLRQERDALIPKLYQHLSIARRAVDQLFGQGKAFVIAGIDGPTEQKPNKMLRQAELVIARFEQPDLELPEAAIEGFEVHPAAAAAGLRAKADRLKQVLRNLRDLRRATQISRKVKNRALDEHQPVFLSIARTLEGFYRLAGEQELADRIRPSGRTTRQVAGDDGDGADAEASASEAGTEGGPAVAEPGAEESADSSAES